MLLIGSATLSIALMSGFGTQLIPMALFGGLAAAAVYTGAN